jgi:hypothetical protein
MVCDTSNAPIVRITEIERTNEKIIAIILLIRILTRCSTRGFRSIAITIEKTRGMIMPFAIYKIAKKAVRPQKKIDALI